MNTDDHDHARLEDDGGPPAPAVERCGSREWYYGLTCDRELGHDGPHRGYLEEHDRVLFWRSGGRR